jgi:Zn-finger nucleic acid-binding protein
MSQIKDLVLSDEDGHELRVAYDNRGEPYRQGVEVLFDACDGCTRPVWVFLDRDEVEKLHEKLGEFLAAK